MHGVKVLDTIIDLALLVTLVSAKSPVITIILFH